ncbi:hypothetical protein BU17DRAFT_66530 [Hysterangium stoloniferum]|nr:hypothetical protein BU17DRAFT_66530 [Hysterangium stoloniferum]
MAKAEPQVERDMRGQPHMIPGLELMLASVAAAFPAWRMVYIDAKIVNEYVAVTIVIPIFNRNNEVQTYPLNDLECPEISSTSFPGGKDGSLYLSDGTWFNIRIESSSSLGEPSTGRRDAERVESESKTLNANCLREKTWLYELDVTSVGEECEATVDQRRRSQKRNHCNPMAVYGEATILATYIGRRIAQLEYLNGLHVTVQWSVKR